MSNVRHVCFGARNAHRAVMLYEQASAIDGEDLGAAADLYEQAIRLDPGLGIAHVNLGNIRYREGNTQAALECWRQALAVEPGQPEVHYNIGYHLLEQGDAKSAIPRFQRAIAEYPEFADAWFNLAYAYEATGKAKNARTAWKRYLEIEPNGAFSDVARRKTAPTRQWSAQGCGAVE